MKFKTALIFLSFYTFLTPLAARCDTQFDTLKTLSSDIEQWWIACHGNSDSSTCLEDSEVSKFKTLCMSEINKADCQTVTDYAVAKSRLGEAKRLLLVGQTALRKAIANNKFYPEDASTIWDQSSISAAKSFAVGILPSCIKKNKKELLFGSNVRPEIDDFRDQMQKYYEELAIIPCPGGETILVVIGQIHDSKTAFDSYSISIDNKFKTIRSSLGASPFSSEADELVSLLKPK